MQQQPGICARNAKSGWAAAGGLTQPRKCCPLVLPAHPGEQESICVLGEETGQLPCNRILPPFPAYLGLMAWEQPGGTALSLSQTT